MAHMVNHRVADAEVTRKIEEQKAERLEAIKAHCRELEGRKPLDHAKTLPRAFRRHTEEVKETVL